MRQASVQPRRDKVRFSVNNLEIHEAFRAALRAVKPSIPVTAGGITGSRLGRPEDDPVPAMPISVEVSAHLEDASLEEILNAIVAQAPGSGWALVRHQDGRREFDTLTWRLTGPGRRSSVSFEELDILPAPRGR